MEDLLEFMIRPVYWLARVLLWFTWEFAVQTVGWHVGWVVCRLLTLGRWPEEGIGCQETVGVGRLLFVVCVGILFLLGIVWFLGSSL